MSQIMSRSNLLTDTDCTDPGGTDPDPGGTKQKHSVPGIKTFTVLVGMMATAMLVFVVLFLTCLVVMATSSQYGRSSGHRGRFASPPAGMDGIRAAMAPDRVGTAPGPRENACILVLARNEDLAGLTATLRQFEDRFNKRHNYPYVFLNDKPFAPQFEYNVRSVLAGRRLTFARIPDADWSAPPHIDAIKAADSRRKLSHIIHGASQSYRKMCRWYSGRFMWHQAVRQYDWFWRIEPGVHFACDIHDDPFVRMRREKKVIGFSMMMAEIEETIPSLFHTVLHFKHQHQIKPQKQLWDYFTYTAANGTTAYNGCHIWNNFEIARFDFFRSPHYQQYFEHLDRHGGFFYERWGDAPVISLAAALFLKHHQLLQFDTIGYRHDDSSFCPADPRLRTNLLCTCDPYDHGDTTMSSCMTLWRRLLGDAVSDESLL